MEKKRKLFHIVACELINIEGITELESHSLATTAGIIVWVKYSRIG